MGRKLHIKMPDNSVWAVPTALIIADHAKHYADEEPISEDEDDEIMDWAANNMNWSGVQHEAKLVSPPDVDFEDGWVNGDKEIVDE